MDNNCRIDLRTSSPERIQRIADLMINEDLSEEDARKREHLIEPEMQQISTVRISYEDEYTEYLFHDSFGHDSDDTSNWLSSYLNRVGTPDNVPNNGIDAITETRHYEEAEPKTKDKPHIDKPDAKKTAPSPSNIQNKSQKQKTTPNRTVRLLVCKEPGCGKQFQIKTTSTNIVIRTNQNLLHALYVISYFLEKIVSGVIRYNSTARIYKAYNHATDVATSHDKHRPYRRKKTRI
ncbi:hypothetical protein BDD12DRAFT_312361 [Trichophaea hybrida]|nr:hypothetical protein BDD12DRAFT_312361 [Trichophaea hybrida]